MRRQLFGDMPPLSKEEYTKIFQSTGIDIDGRQELLQRVMPSVEKSIKQFISFAKTLPGFQELPMDDQISLVKGKRTPQVQYSESVYLS